ncbi:unnamed protein product [Prorocentrum cordatum]|uniref:Uncharacterized protein n=1 Tax=Prorocentrum cordatum TaxID=2364126 RepID=A0ABN9Y5B5_9DINO|nr:unnamed protein product [Polarella glacialis]
MAIRQERDALKRWPMAYKSAQQWSQVYNGIHIINSPEEVARQGATGAVIEPSAVDFDVRYAVVAYAVHHSAASGPSAAARAPAVRAAAEASCSSPRSQLPEIAPTRAADVLTSQATHGDDSPRASQL